MKGRKGKVGFSYAINGIIAVAKHEWNLRVHLIIALLVLLAGFYFQLAAMEWVMVLFVIAFVLITEVINTVVENLIDYLKPEHHPTAGYIKDAAAGAVLLSALTAVIIGLIIFLPKILNYF